MKIRGLKIESHYRYQGSVILILIIESNLAHNALNSQSAHKCPWPKSASASFTELTSFIPASSQYCSSISAEMIKEVMTCRDAACLHYTSAEKSTVCVYLCPIYPTKACHGHTVFGQIYFVLIGYHSNFWIGLFSWR